MLYKQDLNYRNKEDFDALNSTLVCIYNQRRSSTWSRKTHLFDVPFEVHVNALSCFAIMSLHMFSTKAQECVHAHIQASLRLLRSKTNNNNEKARLAHYEHIWNISGNNFRIFYFAKLIMVTSNTEMWFWHFPKSFSLKELLFAPKTFHLSAFVLLTSFSFNANASSDRSFKPSNWLLSHIRLHTSNMIQQFYAVVSETEKPPITGISLTCLSSWENDFYLQ